MPAGPQCIAREADNPLGTPCFVADVDHNQNAEPLRTAWNDHIHPALSSGYTTARHGRDSLWEERKLGSTAVTGYKIPAYKIPAYKIPAYKIPNAKSNGSARSEQASQPKRKPNACF